MENISPRQQDLFEAIVREYTNTAKPIPSKVVVEKYGFDVSSATVRNDMKELEDLGLITQPHTSAGRIPTAKGYRYFVEQKLNRAAELTGEAKQQLDQLASLAGSFEPEVYVKTMAKGAAQLANEAVLVSLGNHSFYYTGISNIARKPEFAESNELYNLSELIDHLDDVMEKISGASNLSTVRIMVGDENPVSARCSLLVTPYSKDDVQGVMALLGPMRMQYQFNHDLLKYIQTQL